MGSRMSKYKLGDITNASYTNQWDRANKDPITMAVANAIAGAVGVAGATSFVAGTLAFKAIAVVSFFAIQAVVGAVVNALMPKPNLGSAQGSKGLLVNSRDGLSPSEFVYGKIRKGGPVTFLETTGDNNKVLHQIIVLANHEVTSIDEIYLNDEVVTMSNENVTSAPWDGHVKIYKHLGDQLYDFDTFANSSETLRSTLHNETSTGANFIGKGIAYLYCRFEYDQDAFVNGVPLVSAVVRGKKVRSTSNGNSQGKSYSQNPAWIVRDFLTSDYGLGEPESSIDDATFEAAAAVCEESADGIGSNKYQINGVVEARSSIGEVLENMVAACNGTLFWGAGKWRLKAGDWIEPTRAAITLDDIRGPINIDTKVSMRDNFNKVGGTFINGGIYDEGTNPTGGDWVSQDYPEVNADNAFQSVDLDVEKKLDYNLPFTTDAARAQLLAKQLLYRSREQITFSTNVSINCMDIEVGDVVPVTIERYGWDEKPFEVVSWRLEADEESGALSIALTLRETSESSYSFTSADARAISLNNTNLNRFYDVPDISLSVDQAYRVINQNVTNVLQIDVSSVAPERIDYVIVKYKKTGDSSYKTVGQSNLNEEGSTISSFEVPDIETPQIGEDYINYTIVATPVNSFGFRGSQVKTFFNVSADTVPPNAPTNLTKVLSGGTAFFNWEGSTSLDLSHYKLYYNSDTSASFGDVGNEIKVAKIARPATSISFPAAAGKYFISAVDKTGNESQTSVPSVLVDASELPALDVTVSEEEHPSFDGSKSNLTVDSGELHMTNYATSGSYGLYFFRWGQSGLSQLNVSTSRTLRLSYTATHTRKHANAVNGEVNWDDIPDNWDSWPNFWDTWTDEDASFQDHQVIVEARAGGTVAAMDAAPWTAVPCELVGQYVDFRARLVNSGPNVSPSVTALTAIVEY